MAECTHVWKWLPRPVYYIGLLGYSTRVENAECELCHARTWAHGGMPDARPIVATITPTTGRNV